MQKINELSIPSGNQTHSWCNSDLWGKQGCEFTCGASQCGARLHWQECPALCSWVCCCLTQPDISTAAAMQPLGLWGPFLGLAVGFMAGGRWEMQDETFGSFGDHENSLSFRKAENCGVWVHAVLWKGQAKALSLKL